MSSQVASEAARYIVLIYTQRKKFSQYLCFLIKSTILDIALSNCIHELYYRNFTCRGKICIEYSDVTNYNCNGRGLLSIKGNPAFRQVNERGYW